MNYLELESVRINNQNPLVYIHNFIFQTLYALLFSSVYTHITTPEKVLTGIPASTQIITYIPLGIGSI